MSKRIRVRALRPLRPVVAGLLVAVVAGGTVYALNKADPGSDYQHSLASQSKAIFGFGHPLDTAFSGEFSGPGDQAVELAGGLSASIVSSSVGQNADMIALWPNDDSPTYSIICNEIDSADATMSGQPNPDFGRASVQRVNLSTGAVSTIANGLISCDPIHRTDWGTIDFAEENGKTGRLYELINPLDTNDVHIDRATGATSGADAANITVRKALGQLSFEGVLTLPDGTTYYGDELRPSNGKPGGGIYKFVPTAPRSGNGPIASLADSPLATGSVSVLRLGSSGRSFGDFGQGTNLGEGKWAPLTTPADPTTFDLAAAATAAGGYSGFYRPEDMDLDPIAWAAGQVRGCWNNTGNDQAAQWGETLCLTDESTASTAFPGGHRPVVSLFVPGNPELRMADNLDFQPRTGILYILMDATTSAEDPNFANDQVWACLPDGADADLLSDGCLRVMNLKDGEAEFTGIQFLGDGKRFLIHLQHRTQEDRADPNTADEIQVSGLSMPH